MSRYLYVKNNTSHTPDSGKADASRYQEQELKVSNSTEDKKLSVDRFHLSRKKQEAYLALIQDRFQVPHKSIRLCRRVPMTSVYGDVEPSIRYNRTEGRASYSGLVLCRNQVACPCCAPTRRLEKAYQLQKVVDKHKQAGGGVYALHLTIDNNGYETLEEGLNLLAKCWNRLVSGRYGKELKEKWGVSGYFVAKDITINTTKRSYHPHFHTLIRTDKKLSQFEQDSLGHRLIQNWVRIVKSQSNNQATPLTEFQKFHEIYSSDITKDYGKEVSSYIVKVCRGFAYEVTGVFDKKGRVKGSYGIWELLDLALGLDDNDPNFIIIKNLFCDFVEASTKKKWFSNSRDWWSKYEIDEEPEEENEDEIESIPVIYPAYKAINNYGQLSNVLKAVEEQEEAYEDLCNLLLRCSLEQHRIRRLNRPIEWMEGKTGEDLLDIANQKDADAIERYCDAEIYYWIRTHINPVGRIQVRWFQDHLHRNKDGVKGRKPYH